MPFTPLGRARPLRVAIALVVVALALLPAAASAMWSAPVRISGPPSQTDYSDAATVVVDAQGRATAAWKTWVDADMRWEVRVAKLHGSTWTSPQTISTSGYYAGPPALGLDGSGDVTLVWTESPTRLTVPWRMMAATSAAGSGSWSTATVDNAASRADAPPPILLVAPSGTATVIYGRRISGTGMVPHAVRRVGGTWQTPVQLVSTPDIEVTGALTGDGEVVAAWVDGGRIYASELTDPTGNGTWGTAQDQLMGPGTATPLSLAGGPTRVVATWGGGTQLRTIRFTPGTGWMAGDLDVVSSNSSSGRAVPLANGSVAYVYAVGNVVTTRTRSADGASLSTERALSTDAGAPPSYSAWLPNSGYPAVTWTAPATPRGVSVSTQAASGWPAPADASFSALINSNAPVGAGGGTSLSPTSVIVALGDPYPSSVYAMVDDGMSVPGAPTIGTATLSGTDASVQFTPPASSGGSALTYTATCTSGDGGATLSATGAGSPLIVPGLTPGHAYTCTVTAANSLGTSPPSGPSNEIAVPAEQGAPASGPAPSPLQAIIDESDQRRRDWFDEPVRTTFRPTGLISWVGRRPSVNTQVNVPSPGVVRQYGDSSVIEVGDLPKAATAHRAMRVCSTTQRVARAGTVNVLCPLTRGARRALRTRALRVSLITVFVGTNRGRGRSVRTVVIPPSAAYRAVAG